MYFLANVKATYSRNEMNGTFNTHQGDAKCISRYSDWLRAGRPRGRSSSPGRVKNFNFSISSKPALGFTQPPIK
jgi:hypothetical protein